MNKASELFDAGQLDAAIDAAVSEVKQRPTDTAARTFFCDLLCFRGDFERADKQLEIISQQDPSAATGVALYRQLVRAAIARGQFYNDGRLPELIGEPSPGLRLHLEASIHIREGDLRQAAALLAQADSQRVAIAGRCGETAFADFRDFDDLTSCLFEVLTTNGKYYWIGMDQIELIELRPLKFPRDVLWRAARMVVRDGPDGEVYLPALYAGSSQSDDDALRLGRAAQWFGGDDDGGDDDGGDDDGDDGSDDDSGGPTRGLGMRTFMVDESCLPIVDLSQLNFDSPATP